MDDQTRQGAESPEYELAVRAGTMLAEAGLTLSVAESCTGGLLGALLTDIPGSSAYFLGGVIAYADSVKRDVLSVPAELISVHGAVSARVAIAMAQGASNLCRSDLAVAITGVAGPGGGTEDKPVGTTFLALVGHDTEVVEHRVWPYDRSGNRQASVQLALQMVVESLSHTSHMPRSTPNRGREVEAHT
jgi:PncC family amidohydrolase